MKKFIMMLAFVSVSVASMAQADPTEKYSVATNSFWSNWFIQTNVTWNSYYSGGNNHVFSSPFRKFGLGSEPWNDGKHPTGLGFSVAVGKWFTPGLGLRTKANLGWQGKAFKTIDYDKLPIEGTPFYLTVNEQVLFNLSNMICGYNETRVWNFIPYVGAGVYHKFGKHDKANGTVLSAGILNTFRLGRVVSLNLEVGYMNYDKEFLTKNIEAGLNAHSRDHQLTLEVGATFNLGKGNWKKTPDVDAIKALSQGQIDALNAQLSDAQAENARLKNLLANQPKATAAVAPAPEVVTKVVAAPVSVFFNLGQAKVASKKDLQNVSDLAKVAKENNAKIVVTGYADSKTGSAKYNEKLSKQRAEAVANELVKMGVSRDNIETWAAGGVNTLSPINFNRRATVEIK
jgi:outer membrane protein OmpA-like peptidoglycan-associated protein